MLVFIVIGLITGVITIGLGYWSYALGKRNKLNLVGSVIPVGNLVIIVVYALLFVGGRQRFNKQKQTK
ncbi:hypothetical protein [Lactiplantibacillus plantarum]|uniref:hypothetical protein n=1 Tax=Lactiplantibacillus plantarum TaxID=1590 RepID=UPI000F0348A1|nr:hypothetical protein [Lactiplantibacillus plantarum]